MLLDTQTEIENPGTTPVKELEKELQAQKRSHLDLPGEGKFVLSLQIRDAKDDAGVGSKLISKNGKLELVEDAPRADLMPLAASGTSIVISSSTSTASANEKLKALDSTHLIVGTVVEGQEVLKKLRELPVNQSNEDSLFYKAGKSAGDKRALVAAKAFNRPFARIVVTNAGAA